MMMGIGNTGITGMPKIDFLEGSDYSGKSTLIDMIVPDIYCRNNTLTEKQKKMLRSIDNPFDKFRMYFNWNEITYNGVLNHLNGSDELIERSWYSTAVYSNVFRRRIGFRERFEDNQEVQQKILLMIPDRVILVKTSLSEIVRRMKIRPPVGDHEKDPANLMEVQEEFFRFAEYGKMQWGIPYVVIDNSTNSIDDLKKECEKLKQ